MRLFIDNCLSVRHAESLRPVLEEGGHSVRHLREVFPPNTTDEEWLNRLNTEGDWLVLTADNGIRRKPNERARWLRTNLTAFFLLPAWSSLNIYERNTRLFRVVMNMEKYATPRYRGRGFLVRVNCTIEKL